jgi:hypothetical protein
MAVIDHYYKFREFIPKGPVVFLGLHGDTEVVSLAEGQSLAQDLGVDYFEMAATGLETLDTIVKFLLRKPIVLKTGYPCGN